MARFWEAKGMGMSERYFLKADWQTEWQEVTKEKFIKAERAAGFSPKGVRITDPEYWTTLATAGFGGYGVSGKVENG